MNEMHMYDDDLTGNDFGFTNGHAAQLINVIKVSKSVSRTD